jgi:NADPH:quinone reductase-like Zn-dependent oxidoreductase
MKAVCITRLGQPAVLKILEIEKPTPAPGEALLRVSYVGMNWLDVLLRTERLGVTFPHAPGSDVVGVVEEMNGSTEGVGVGDVVVINPAVPCEECSHNCTRRSECRFVRIFGVYCQGGYSQFLRVPLAQLHRKPEVLSHEEAAAFPLDYLTAWRMLFTRGRLARGETVLIWGASGSLGSAAVRLAHVLA